MIKRVLAGLVLFAAAFTGLAIWASSGYLPGAVVFITGAVVAAQLHGTDRKA